MLQIQIPNFRSGLVCFAQLGGLVCSVGLGMGAYLWAHREGDPDENLPLRSEAAAPLTDLVLDVSAHRLAIAEQPVDVVGDALGVYYILQADGKVLRAAPTVEGGYATHLYAELGDERTERSLGFTSLALHPEFSLEGRPGKGRFYVLLAEKAGSREADFHPEFGEGEDHQDVLYEYCVEDPLLPEFRGTRRELMRFRQPGPEHNLSGLAFDPAGHLFLGVGDGARAEVGRGSPSRNASSIANAYGKVLRIDPLGHDAPNGQYGIPESNPFRLVTGAVPELWVFGLRSPLSLSYDPFQRALCIGERAVEGCDEVNLSFLGGEHYGWDIDVKPESLPRSARARLAELVTMPAMKIDPRRDGGGALVGSLVYRGESFPSLAGALLCARKDGQLLALRGPSLTRREAGLELSRVVLGNFPEQGIAGLRSGPRGEVILLCGDGQVFELRKGGALGTGDRQQRSLFCQHGREDRPALQDSMSSKMPPPRRRSPS